MADNSRNLISLVDQPPEKARAIRSAGGRARVQQARDRKTFKQLFDAVLNDKPDKGELTYKELITKAMIKEALKGKVGASEFIRDTIGEKPKNENVNEVAFNNDNNAIAEVLGAIRNVEVKTE